MNPEHMLMGKQYANEPLGKCTISGNVIVTHFLQIFGHLLLENSLGSRTISSNWLTLSASTGKMPSSELLLLENKLLLKFSVTYSANGNSRQQQ